MAPGAMVTFSSSQDPSKIQNIAARTGAMSRFEGIARAFPDIVAHLRKGVPLYVNFYPSGFGNAPGFVSLETGMRAVNVLKAVNVARAQGVPMVLSGAPLPLGHAAVQIEPNSGKKAPYLLIAIGGYTSFPALEAMIAAAFQTAFERVEFLHVYGLNEVDFALMAGQRSDDGQVQYRLIQDDWRPDGPTFLHQRSGERVECEDQITETSGGFIVKQAVTKLSDPVRAFLRDQSPEWWRRNTGHLGASGGVLVHQLRRGQVAREPSELSFGAFIDRFGMEMQDKPRWGLLRG